MLPEAAIHGRKIPPAACEKKKHRYSKKGARSNCATGSPSDLKAFRQSEDSAYCQNPSTGADI